MASVPSARAAAPGQVVRLHSRQPKIKLTSRSVLALPGPGRCFTTEPGTTTTTTTITTSRRT
jgi:hypothetical protein